MPSLAPVHPLELISARIDGEITTGEVRFLEAHLKTCPACQQTEADLSTIASGLAALSVAAPPVDALEGLLGRLREQGARAALAPALVPAPVTAVVAKALVAECETAVSSRRHWAPWLAMGATAAVVAVLVLAYALSAPPEPVDPLPFPIGADASRAPVPPDLACSAAATCQPDSGAPPPPLAAEPAKPVPIPPTTRPRISGVPAAVPVPVATAEPSRPAATPPRAAPVATTRVNATSERAQVDRVTASTVLQPIYFNDDGKRLNREAKEILESVARVLQQHPEVELWIDSRTGERTSVEKNRSLSERRALLVVRELERLGVASSRLRPRFHSEARPSDDNNRVDFSLKR